MAALQVADSSLILILRACCCVWLTCTAGHLGIPVWGCNRGRTLGRAMDAGMFPQILRSSTHRLDHANLVKNATLHSPVGPG